MTDKATQEFVKTHLHITPAVTAGFAEKLVYDYELFIQGSAEGDAAHARQMAVKQLDDFYKKRKLDG